MKKKFFAVLTALIAVCVVAFCCSACTGETVSVENVTLNKSTLTLEIGEEETLTATITPNNATDKRVTWESSDKGVATVSNGKVRAVANGRTTISATTVDGEKTAICEVTVIASTGLTFKTLSIDEENNVKGTVSNSIDEFSFLTEIEISGNIGYIVCADEFGLLAFAAKKVPLIAGDTTVYILVLENGEYNGTTYTVTIHRNYLYTVSFKTGVATSIPSQQVEEGDCAIIPTTELTKIGYHFDGWGFDFDTPITSNKTLNAIWTANTDTPYRVEYYLEKATDDGYRLFSTENNIGVTADTASVNPREKDHYTINESKSKLSGNIAPDGSLVLKVYYDLDRYAITVNSSDTSLGTVTGGGTYKHGIHLNMVATTNKLGYVFIGWFNGTERVSENQTYSFSAKENLDLIAKWELDPAISNFHFTSTESVCEITGLKDENVTQIVIPDYVTSIGERAFYCGTFDSPIATSVTIGKGVTSIGKEAFYDCYKLTKVDYTGTIDQWAEINFVYSSSSNPLYYAKNLYIDGKLVTEVNITSATKITDFAFSKYPQLTSLTIGGDVSYIGEFAFYECDLLTNVTISGNVTKIAEFAFSNCDLLVNLTIGNNVESIESKAFYDCDALRSIVIPDSVKRIGTQAFYSCSSLMNITLGANLNTVEEDAFANCYKLVEVIYNQEDKSPRPLEGSSGFGKVHYYALRVGYKGYTSRLSTDSNGCTVYTWSNGKSVFVDYSGDSSYLSLPNNITEINSHAFDRDTVEALVIPNSVTRFNEDAFYNCYELEKVYYMGTIDQWAELTFENVYSTPFCYGCALYIDNQMVTEINLTSAKTISKYAFKNYSKLTSVKMGTSVESIGEEVFYNCDSLTTIEIGENVVKISKNVFTECDNLESVIFKDDSTWYRTSNADAWDKMIAGKETTVTNASDMAFDLSRSAYRALYWYKK